MELRAALEPLLDRLLADRLRYFQLQFEPRVQALIAAAIEFQAGLRRIQNTNGASECFDAIYELSGVLVGRQRRLEVLWQGKAAVWKGEGGAWATGVECESRDICVRGSAVGRLSWAGGTLAAAVGERLDMLLRFSGMVLLEGALQVAEAARRAKEAQNEPKTLAPEVARSETRAQRFASLLIEDLRLFLERERAPEFAAGMREGDWRLRFAPELERCRRAFRSRFDAVDTFEEVVPRLVELPG